MLLYVLVMNKKYVKQKQTTADYIFIFRLQYRCEWYRFDMKAMKHISHVSQYFSNFPEIFNILVCVAEPSPLM